MSKKQNFVNEIEGILKELMHVGGEDPLTADSRAYWEAFKGKEETDKPLFTDNGKLVLKYMQEHIVDMPMAKAKDIGEGLFISSRAVSGAMRKLVIDGFVEKIGQDPVVYALTDNGKNIEIV